MAAPHRRPPRLYAFSALWAFGFVFGAFGFVFGGLEASWGGLRSILSLLAGEDEAKVKGR